MKSYFILNCDTQRDISDHLHGYYLEISANSPTMNFWNPLSREQIKTYLSIPNNPTRGWFDSMSLRIRDISYTVCSENISTSIHTDRPPVIAKINFPVLNTQDTYNVWYDHSGNEIDRVECVKPIVLRSDIPHTVEIGDNAVFPRVQFSFCFYDEPLHLLM